MTYAKHGQIDKHTANLMYKRQQNTGATHSLLCTIEPCSTLMCFCGTCCDVGASKVFKCPHPLCQFVFGRDPKSADFILVLAFAIALCLAQTQFYGPTSLFKADHHGGDVN